MNETISILINVIAKSVAAFFLLSRILSILWFIDHVNYSTILDVIIIISLLICLFDFFIRKKNSIAISRPGQAMILTSLIISIYQFLSQNINLISILLLALLIATFAYHFSRIGIKSRL